MTRLGGLDDLRGIAAIAVLLFHASVEYGTFQLFPFGFLAVDFFFALSGYVMARCYEPRMREGGGAGFVAERIGRFWPMMLVGALLGLPLLVAQVGPTAIPVAVLNLLLIPVPAVHSTFPVDAPFWSLHYELVANAAHALWFWRLRTRPMLALIGALAVAMMAVTYAHDGYSVGPIMSSYLPGLLRTALAYLIGVWLYRVWQDEPSLRVPPALAYLALPLALFAIGRGPFEALFWQPLFVVVAVPLVMAGGIAASGSVRLLGDLSFPLYVVHYPIITSACWLGLPMWSAIHVSLVLAAAIARLPLATWRWRPTPRVARQPR